MQDSYQGLSIQDIQDEFNVSRSTAKAGGSTMSLNERLFLNRLELAEKIKDKSFKVLYV